MDRHPRLTAMTRIDDTFVLARFGWAAPITIENSTSGGTPASAIMPTA